MVELSNVEEAWIVAENELRATKQELHDLRRRVSDMASAYIKHAFTVQEKHLSGYKVTVGFEKQADATAWFDQLLSLPDFIIHEPKPDPLAKTLGAFDGTLWEPEDVSRFRAALDAAGFEIREKNND